MYNLRIGFALTGSFCTFAKAFKAMEELVTVGHSVTPIMSENAYSISTRFGSAEDNRARCLYITGNDIIHTIEGAEPIGPKGMFDILVVAPCTSNTMAKLATGVNDTAVTMAVKSHLRGARPVVIAPSTNDALAASAKNIGTLLNTKHYFFCPFGQDDTVKKPMSMVADLSRLTETVDCAMNGVQVQPTVNSVQ